MNTKPTKACKAFKKELFNRLSAVSSALENLEVPEAITKKLDHLCTTLRMPYPPVSFAWKKQIFHDLACLQLDLEKAEGCKDVAQTVEKICDVLKSDVFAFERVRLSMPPAPAIAEQPAINSTQAHEFLSYQSKSGSVHKVLMVPPGLPIECVTVPASLFMDAALDVIRKYCDDPESASLWAAFNLVEVAKGLVDSIGGAG